MINRKPSDLNEILKAREAKIAKKYSFAKKVFNYNQPYVTPKRAKKHSYDHDR